MNTDQQNCRRVMKGARFRQELALKRPTLGQSQPLVIRVGVNGGGEGEVMIFEDC